MEGLVLQHLTVARIAEGLAVAWNPAVSAEGRRRLSADPRRFEPVKTIGVDERIRRHTSHGDKYVTVIIDLTLIRNGTGPSRLLDMVASRTKQVFKTWLTDCPQDWRDGVEVTADAETTRSTAPAGPCTPAPVSSQRADHPDHGTVHR